MKRFFSKYVYKNAAAGPLPQIHPDETEEPIFKFIREACVTIGTITGVQPTAVVAGGWVRDNLLGKQSKDIDISVDSMDAEEFARWLKEIADQNYGSNQNFVSEAINTAPRTDQDKNIAVVFMRINQQDVDLLSMRVEYYEPNNRNPFTVGYEQLVEIAQNEGIPRYLKVKRPDLLEKLSSLPPADRNDPLRVLAIADTYRRDLTFNALFYNLTTQQVEDKTGRGIDDLGTMNLSTPLEPSDTFRDDPLRVLRVLRFQSRYPNSTIEPEVLKAMAAPEVQHQIVRRLYGDSTSGIVPERTSEELRKLFMGEQPEAALRTMYEVGLLQKMLLLPQEYNPLEMDQRNKHHALTVIEHTLAVVKNVNNLSKEFGFDNKQRMMMNFTSLFHDLGKLDPRSHKNKDDGSRGYSGDPNNPNAVSHQQASQDQWHIFADALKFSDEEKSTISELVLNHMNPHAHVEDNAQPTDRQLRRYLRKNPSWVFQYVHAMADSMSKGPDPNQAAADPYRANLERLRALAPTADAFGNSAPVIELLKGQEIIQIVGLPPNPPRGMQGYIEVVKEAIREAQDQNPDMQQPDAIRIVQDLANFGRTGQGILAPYFQSAV